MKLINSIFVGLITFLWASVSYIGNANLQLAQAVTSLDLQKPFVYRALIPFLARLVSSFGIRIDLALTLVITVSGIGFYLALRELYFYLYRHDAKGEIYLVCAVMVGLILFFYPRMTYDLMTAFLFTLAFLFIIQGKDWQYLVVFILSCFNRETTFLLIIVYVVVNTVQLQMGRKWWMTLCQIYFYALITVSLRIAFQHNPGSSLWIEPLQNLQKYISHPLQTLLWVGIIAVIWWRISVMWKYRNPYPKLLMVVLAPVLVVFYLVCGQAFEMRVFWELYPVLVLFM